MISVYCALSFDFFVFEIFFSMFALVLWGTLPHVIVNDACLIIAVRKIPQAIFLQNWMN
jgi:hypothetical protein